MSEQVTLRFAGDFELGKLVDFLRLLVMTGVTAIPVVEAGQMVVFMPADAALKVTEYAAGLGWQAVAE